MGRQVLEPDVRFGELSVSGWVQPIVFVVADMVLVGGAERFDLAVRVAAA